MEHFMNHNSSFSIRNRLKSFKSALNGIIVLIRTQHNAWIHALLTITVCAAGFYFRFTLFEWCWIIFAIVIVWTAEAFNTSIEFLVDVTSPGFHPLAGKAKDLAAAAVLISAIGSAIIGILILIPYLIQFFN